MRISKKLLVEKKGAAYLNKRLLPTNRKVLKKKKDFKVFKLNFNVE